MREPPGGILPPAQMLETPPSGVSRVSWFDTVMRLQHIGMLLAKHGFGEFVARIGLMVPRLSGAAPVPSRERIASRLADVLTELGPTYIKLGQLLATRVDLFPPEVIRALSSLHASVRAVPFSQVAKILKRELGQPLDQVFARFDEACLAAASMGQVHRAICRDGTPVVVKVQRPGLRAQVEADLAIMGALAGLLAQHVPEVAAYEPIALVEAFARSITQELDFRVEASNARRLGRVLAGAPEVRVPRVYPAWSSERVLVMEYVEGTGPFELPPVARARVRRALVRAFARQILEHGVFHADPHPGNLLVLSNGQLVLLDLGTIDALDVRLRLSLFRLALALFLRRHEALCDEVLRLGHGSDTGVDRKRLAVDIQILLNATSRGGGAGMLGQVLTMSRVHGLRLPPALVALMRALAMLDGVLRGLEPAGDIVRDVRREIGWAVLRVCRRKLFAPFCWLLASGAGAARRVMTRLRPERGAASTN